MNQRITIQFLFLVRHAPTSWGPLLLRRLHKPGGKSVDLDPARRRQIKEYQTAMIESEVTLTSLASEAGGKIWLPESLDQMIADGAGVARLIDAEYFVTYRPSRAFTSSGEDDVRRIEIVSRRVGLSIISRRSYVARER